MLPPTRRLVVHHPSARQLVGAGRQAQPRCHAVVELRPGGLLSKGAAACKQAQQAEQAGGRNQEHPQGSEFAACGTSIRTQTQLPGVAMVQALARTYCGHRPSEIQIDHRIVLLGQPPSCSGTAIQVRCLVFGS